MKKILAFVSAIALAAMFCGAVYAAEEAAKPAAEPAKAAAEPAKAAAEAAPKYGNKVGDILKPVKLKTFPEGKEVDTSKIEKKSLFVMVNTVCGMCQREMTDFDRNMEDLKKADIYIVVIDQEQDRAVDKYKKFLDTAKLLHDPDFKLGDAVGLSSTPSTVVLDKGGKIVLKENGYSPDVMKALKAAL